MYRLYNEAEKWIGRDASPADEAPDELGCANSVSKIIQRAYPELNFPTLLSTRQLYDYFTSSPSFRRAEHASYGCIILSVTGMGNGVLPNGHVGILGQYTAADGTLWVMSNDSATGLWEVNYTIGSWNRRYKDKGGMETMIFERC